jgi:nicotinamidase-related amidase
MRSAQTPHHSPAGTTDCPSTRSHEETRPSGRDVDDLCKRSFVEQIQPDEDNYFVLKPMHSGFYQTPLEVLLRYLDASTLVLCGLTTNSCIVCTAHDAKMREFELYVPSDYSAARTAKEHRQGIEHIRMMTNAKVAPSGSLRLNKIARGARK